MYSLPAHHSQGFWSDSGRLPDIHSRWLTPESTVPSSCASQVRRPLTPPQDMQSLAHSYRSVGGRYEEPAHYRTDREPVDKPYLSQYDSATEFTEGQRTSSNQRSKIQHQAPSSKQPSPALSHISFSSAGQSRKGSHQSSIAPSLQIPRSINNSRGSLSDLAAQIACLFWFESSEVLDLAEKPENIFSIPHKLSPDTIPTTGFRKWVTTILSTTQVAQNVILLALLFIYRLKRQNPSVKGKPGSEYRLLTVALMLGNKFLDDNTYTNKTWAEVSGISVMEVHIMEVEFLSNMKYNLFTSAEQWTAWQHQLGYFARFLERATESPQIQAAPFPSQSASNLPSPPFSYHASPPRSFTPAQAITPQNSYTPQSTLPGQSAPPYKPAVQPTVASRKRSLDIEDDFTASKRVMYGQSYSQQIPPQHLQMPMKKVDIPVQQQQAASNPVYPPFNGNVKQQPTPRESYVPPQLPPLSQQLKGTPNSLPPSWQNTPSLPHPSSLAMALQSARTSRNHSPYLSSTNVSPTNAVLMPSNCVTPQTGSPSVFLAHRDSPYRPVRGVHTLLVPPPSRAMHHVEQVGNTQMHYQPLSKPPFSDRQQGRLPYIAQNQWLDGFQNRPPMTYDQWPNNPFNTQQQNTRY